MVTFNNWNVQPLQKVTVIRIKWVPPFLKLQSYQSQPLFYFKLNFALLYKIQKVNGPFWSHIPIKFVAFSIRSNHRECSMVFVKNSQNPLENTCVGVFFNTVAALRPRACKFIKKETLTQLFSCELCENFKNTPGGCFFVKYLKAFQ